MLVLLVIILAIFICFAGVIIFGAPYLPTLKPQVNTALEIVSLKPGKTLLELGCGDGRVLIAAARMGVKSVGYELNPILALIAWARTRRYRKYVKVVWGNYWRAQWPPADYIFTFLLERYMTRLDQAIEKYSSKPVYLISFAFSIPLKSVVKEKDGVYLYRYTSIKQD